MTSVSIVSRKGGVGVSTLAVALASYASRVPGAGPVALVDCHRGNVAHLAAGLVPSRDSYTTDGNLTVMNRDVYESMDVGRFEFVVFDDDAHAPVGHHVVGVVSTSYLSLALSQDDRWPYVLVSVPGAAIDADAAISVLGQPPITHLGWDAAVARAVDAGMLMRRAPRAISGPASELYHHLDAPEEG